MHSISGNSRSLIGMVHAGALPGTPRASRHTDVSTLADRAAAEAKELERCGFDAVMIENMHDVPYLKGTAGPEIVASMAVIGRAVTAAVGIPCGVQILAAANKEAVAVAQACGMRFVRVEGFTFAHVADEGIIDGCAGELLRFRRAIGADGVLVLADIRKKHSSHAITVDVDIAGCAKAAEFCGADGVIVTGSHTGEPAAAADLQAARGAVGIPVLVGSGATPETVAACLRHADAVIVGTAIKEQGDWRCPVDPDRARRFAESFHQGIPNEETA
jgi:membrane complex biogenesis BtpA family protein